MGWFNQPAAMSGNGAIVQIYSIRWILSIKNIYLETACRKWNNPPSLSTN